MIYFRFFFLIALLLGRISGLSIVEAQSYDSDPSPLIKEEIKIGLLISKSENLSAKHGGELAIEQANEKGGFTGHQFQLVVRSVEGPWGTGSKEAVNLVFEEDVVAIAASLDGRNAHLLEQVAAKTRIVCLTLWATEITLTQAFVPWHYRCIPNDDQQAIALINEIYKKRKLKNVVVIGSEDYDSRNAVQSFINVTDLLKIPSPKQLLFQSPDQEFKLVLDKVLKDGIEAVVLFVEPGQASDIISLLRQLNKNLMIYGSLTVGNDQKASDPDLNMLEGITLISSNHWFTDEGFAFQKEFQKVYGYNPGAAAAYAYDGINLIIESVMKNGPDRDKIIDNFTEMKRKSGVTGEISFDAHGNRAGIPDLMIIRGGIPVLIKSYE